MAIVKSRASLCAYYLIALEINSRISHEIKQNELKYSFRNIYIFTDLNLLPLQNVEVRT